MKKSGSKTGTAACVAMFALMASLSRASDAAMVDWEQQIRQPLYVLYLTSNINVINGLDLTREQAERLRALAREVEQAAPAPVALDPKQAGPFSAVVATDIELRETLLRGEALSPELKNKVVGARLTEVGALRRSLLAEGQGRPAETCTQCHARPDESFGKGPTGSFRDSLRFDNRQQARAHIDLLMGPRAMAAIWLRGAKAEAILTGYQKAAFDDFACCLLPPDMSGGALKIGQADDPSKMMAVLEKARAASASDWPAVKEKIFAGLIARDRGYHPRRSPQEEKKAADRLAATLQRARDLSDVDFMIKKNELCSELEPPRVTTTNPGLLRFKMGFFLLLPGSVRAYDAYLERLAKKEAAGVAQASDSAPQAR